jgi:hypothetical protein
MQDAQERMLVQRRKKSHRSAGIPPNWNDFTRDSRLSNAILQALEVLGRIWFAEHKNQFHAVNAKMCGFVCHRA